MKEVDDVRTYRLDTHSVKGDSVGGRRSEDIGIFIDKPTIAKGGVELIESVELEDMVVGRLL